MNTEELLTEIHAAFPVVEMPDELELPFHTDGCWQCGYLVRDLEEVRGKTMDGNVISLIYQEMSCLSAKGWSWALPHYLRYCLTAEAEYLQRETESLIYNLDPGEQFELETRKCMSLLNERQIRCLIH